MLFTKDYFSSAHPVSKDASSNFKNGMSYRFHRKITSEIIFLSSISMISDSKNSNLSIHLTLKNGLMALYLEEFLANYKIRAAALSDKIIFKNQLNSIVVVLNIGTLSIDLIIIIVKGLLYELKLIGLANEKETFFIEAVNQFKLDYLNHFPLREDPKVTLPIICGEIHHFSSFRDQLELEMMHAHKDSVRRMLQRGYDLLSSVESPYLMITLTYFFKVLSDFPTNIKHKILSYNSIILLLLCYGADPTQPDQQENSTTLDLLVDWGTSQFQNQLMSEILKNDQKKIVFEVFEALLQLITASKKARPGIIPHRNDHTVLADFVRKSNETIIKRTINPRTLFRVEKTINTNTNSIQYIRALDGKRIFIRSLPMKELKRDQEMFGLFKQHYPWQKKIAKQDLKTYFYKNFIQSEKETYVDLVFLNDMFVGFNIAEIHHMTINNQDTMFHRVKLALASPEIKEYKRLMSIVSFQRGFALQRKHPSTRVVSGFEVASKASYLQIRDFDNSTLWLHDFIPLVQRFYENEEIIFNEKSQLFYMKDDLAYDMPTTTKSEWLTPADLYLKFYDEFLVLPDHDFIVVFDSNDKNFQIIAEAIDPLLADTTFDDIVNQLVDEKSQLRAKM